MSATVHQGRAIQGSPYVVLARVSDDSGNLLTAAGASAIVYDLTDISASTPTHYLGPVTVSTSVLLSSPVIDNRWGNTDKVGYNAAIVLPSTTFGAGSGGKTYRLEIRITETNGNVVKILDEIAVIPTYN